MAFEYASEAKIEQFLNISSGTKTSILTDYEAVAQGMINDYLGVDTLSSTTGAVETITELKDYHYLRNYPVNSITSILSKDDHAGSTTTTVETTSYRLDTRKLNSADSTPKAYMGKIIYTGAHLYNVYGLDITYDHGYSTLPEDLIHLAVELTARLYLESYETDAETHFDILSREKAETSITYSREKYPRRAMLILDKYKRDYGF